MEFIRVFKVCVYWSYVYLARNCSLQSYGGEPSLSQERSHWMTNFQEHTIQHKTVSVLAQLSSHLSTVNKGKKENYGDKREHTTVHNG